MTRIINRVVLALFIFASLFVVVLLVKGSTDQTKISQNIEDAKASTMLTGRYVEHLIVERVHELNKTVSANSTREILNSVITYADFVASIYGHRGDFSVGYADSGFRLINSINSNKPICGIDKMFNERVVQTLFKGGAYVGPLPKECFKDSDQARDYVMFAVPKFVNDNFIGVAYEVSAFMNSIDGYKLVNYFSDKISSLLLIDQPLMYQAGTFEYKLLDTYHRVRDREIVRSDGKLIGFYPIPLKDMHLCLVNIRDESEGFFSFECCAWVHDYKVLIFSSPIIFLTLLVILQIVNSNKMLGHEVKLRTEHLENLQKRYQGLFETIPEYVVLYRSDGEVVECNSMFAGLLNGGNPIGANLFFLVKEKERLETMIKAIFADGEASFMEFTLTGWDGPKYVSVHSCIVEIGDQRKILSVMTDLSDYKKMQNTYYLAQKREVVGTLAAGMVHDFSNILQNIFLQYSLLERASDERKPEHMKKIESVISGANKYLSGVLSYTKDKVHEPELKKGSEFIRNSIDMIGRVLPAEVSVRYTDESGEVKIKGIQSKFTQMLINLCQNASDAMDGRGTIYISTSVEEKPFGHFFRLSVKDSGCGIPEDMLDKIYKPFFTTKEGKGTGIGLATVKQIVIEMGGFIEVKSSTEGTEFILMFSEMK